MDMKRSSSPLAGGGHHRLEIAFRESGIAVGSYRNVHLTAYTGDLTMERLERADAAHRELARRHPRTLVLGWAAPVLAIPSAEVRARAAEMIADNAHYVDASALVVDAGGFWASAVRSVMTAAFALARQPTPSRCFASAADAAQWFAGFPSGTGLGPTALGVALGELSRHASSVSSTPFRAMAPDSREKYS